ncbi:MAG: ABC transporter ATP-binding protein [Candidatus Accumulibacter sp.]|jgi:ABC-type branched-subunit amino acid transport system ATPase component|nr:ABC transporter ATP-binding protein [Accumulibacter sp.]
MIPVSDEPLLRAEKLTMRFGGLVALDALDIEVRPREILGLLGPNGSGKTTFFNVVTGLYAASSGTITFEGRNISGLSPQAVYQAGITRTFQRSRLSLSLSVFDNVAVGNSRMLDHGIIHNLFCRKALLAEYERTVEQVRTLLATFNAALAGKLFHSAAGLSMIDRRRVEICRALISEPRLLLLDEPSAGMTHDETAELMDDIMHVREKLAPFSVVIIEHEMNVIQRTTERCVVLNYGKKIAEGSYAEITVNADVRAAYLGQE